MSIDISKYGAADVRRSATKSPLHLLVTLIKQNPKLDKQLLFECWVAKMCELDNLASLANDLDPDGYLWAALRHTFINLFNSLHLQNKRAKSSAFKDTHRSSIENIKKQVKERVMLMNLTLPNGKRLSDATFADCLKTGGWFAKVAAKGKPMQIVGDVLTEQDLQRIKH